MKILLESFQLLVYHKFQTVAEISEEFSFNLQQLQRFENVFEYLTSKIQQIKLCLKNQNYKLQKYQINSMLT